MKLSSLKPNRRRSNNKRSPADIELAQVERIRHLMGSGVDARYAGRVSAAIRYFQEALTMLEKLRGNADPDTAAAAGSLAGCYQAMGRNLEAQNYYARAIGFDVDNFQPALETMQNNEMAPIFMAGMCSVWIAMGQYGNAELLCRNTIVIMERVYAPGHPYYFQLAHTIYNLGKIYAFTDRYADAEIEYKRALLIYESLPGQESSCLMVRVGLGQLYTKLARLIDAEEIFKGVLTTTRQQSNDLEATASAELAELYRLEGRTDEAQPSYQRALSIFKGLHGVDHPLYVICLANYAKFCHETGRLEEAKLHFARMIKGALKHLKGTPGLAVLLSNYAELLRAINELDEAAKMEALAEDAQRLALETGMASMLD